MFGLKSTKHFLMHCEFNTITELLNYALHTPDQFGKGIHVVGTVSQELANSINSVIGLPTLGLRITIDHSSILHVFRQHGKDQTERLRGQLPVTATDIVQLAEWLAQPDYVEDAGQKAGEPRCLRFFHAHANELITVVLSVRMGRQKQQLSLKTMYKKRLATGATSL